MDLEKRILIIDDLVTMRKALELGLERMGYTKVTVANDEREALTLLEQRQFDLVISDCDMPELGGIELLKVLRANPAHLHVPCLMLSTAYNKNKALELIASGADDLLIKPFTAATLKEKVAQLLSLGQSAKHPSEPIIPAPVMPVGPEPEPGERNRILVVDDVELNIKVVSTILDGQHRVLKATSGEQALAIAESDEPPDLILLDIRMPGMDGLEVCRRLKANPMTQAIPVIFLTAMSETQDVVRGLALGAVDYVTKPLNLQILNARVTNHLQLKHSRDKLQREVDLQMSNARLREDVERITHHDLKNPLSAIINISDVLAADSTCSEDFRESLKHIEESAHEMLEMINRSLDLYKIETGSYGFSPQPVDLRTLLEKVRRDAIVVAQPRGVSISLDLAPGDAIVAGEELLCYSLFGNLVRNAIEASPARGVVRIDSRTATPCTIRISNAGAVPREIRRHFFEKYVTYGKEGGTGLGTYSAKLLTEVQRGAIAFETSEETGTTVQVALKPYSH